MRRPNNHSGAKFLVAILFVLVFCFLTTFTPHDVSEPDPAETVNPASRIYPPVSETPKPWETTNPNTRHTPEPDPTETLEPIPTETPEPTEAPVPSEEPTQTAIGPEAKPVIVTAVYHEAPIYWPDEDFTSSEAYDYLKRKVIAECGGESLRGIKGVVQVIYDRVLYGNSLYGDGLIEVLDYPGAFTKAYQGDTSAWDEKVDAAIRAVCLEGERVWDKHVFYFYNPTYSDESGRAFMESQQYVEQIGNHVFVTKWGE